MPRLSALGFVAGNSPRPQDRQHDTTGVCAGTIHGKRVLFEAESGETNGGEPQARADGGGRTLRPACADRSRMPCRALTPETGGVQA